MKAIHLIFCALTLISLPASAAEKETVYRLCSVKTSTCTGAMRPGHVLKTASHEPGWSETESSPKVATVEFRDGGTGSCAGFVAGEYEVWDAINAGSSGPDEKIGWTTAGQEIGPRSRAKILTHEIQCDCFAPSKRGYVRDETCNAPGAIRLRKSVANID